MYLRRCRRKKGGVEYESWVLVKSVRTASGPRQMTVATIGKLPGLDEEERVGWEEIARVLNGKPRSEGDLFEKQEEIPSWATVDIKRVSVERMRHFGDIYLGLALWKRLGLEQFCEANLPSSREEISWSLMVCVLALARFCAPPRNCR
jgi:hypothetical protein